MITNEIYFFKNQSSVSTSGPLYNVNDGVLILQVDGNASNLELSVLGNTDLIDDDFIALKTINASNYNMSDKITSTGIYWIDINGIRKIKLNLNKITGSVSVKALTKRGLTTDLVARAMAANSQSGGCSLEEVKAITGELTNLNTEDKTNLVNAINEVASNSGGDNNDVSIYTWIYNNFPNYNSYSIKDGHGTFFQDIINDAYTKGKKGIIVIKTSKNGSGLNIDNQYALTATNCNLQLQPTVIAFFGAPVSMDTNINQRMNFQWARVRASGTWDNGVFTLNYLYWDGVKNVSFLPTNNGWSYTPTSDYNPATKKYVDNKKTSWNDLEDKPFGESNDITLVAEQTVSLEGSVFGTATITPDYYEEFIEGATYIVKYKNQTYNIVIGEEYTMTNSSGQSYTFTSTNTKIRFLDLTNLGGIVDINAENRQYKISDSAGSNPELIISLTRKGSIITIDEKFIPDNISTKEYVNNSIQTAIGTALERSY